MLGIQHNGIHLAQNAYRIPLYQPILSPFGEVHGTVPDSEQHAIHVLSLVLEPSDSYISVKVLEIVAYREQLEKSHEQETYRPATKVAVKF